MTAKILRHTVHTGSAILIHSFIQVLQALTAEAQPARLSAWENYMHQPIPSHVTHERSGPDAVGDKSTSCRYAGLWNLLRWRAPPSHNTVTIV